MLVYFDIWIIYVLNRLYSTNQEEREKKEDLQYSKFSKAHKQHTLLTSVRDRSGASHHL